MSATFWNQRAEKYDANLSADGEDFQRTLKALTDTLNMEDRVLDFGCASGAYAIALSPSVAYLHGIDYSDTMIKLAQGKVKNGDAQSPVFSTASLQDSELKAQNFTAVLALNVLHLVDNTPDALHQIFDLLPTGGQLVAQTPCLGERPLPFRILIGLFMKLGLAPKIHRLTYSQLEASVVQAGLEVTVSEVWDEATRTHWIIARKP